MITVHNEIDYLVSLALAFLFGGIHMSQEELAKGVMAICKVFQSLAIETSRKREEQEVEKALQSAINKKKKAHDEFHKFVRSL